MRRTLVPIACLFASLPVLAQNANPVAPVAPFIAHLQVTGPPPLSRYCPAGLLVGPGASAGLVAVKMQPGQQDSQTDGIMTRFHLTTTDKSIVAMRITAHGFGKQRRLLPLADSIHSTLAKEVSVSLWPTAEGTPYGEVELEHFAGITAIDVDEVNYANGTRWHSGPGQVCTVVPDRLMFISSR